MSRLVEGTRNHGLVEPPAERDCVGADCPYDMCYVDLHHLYHSEEKFSRTELRKEFREHPFNKVFLSRCRHNQVHIAEPEGIVVPGDRVMEAFLDEAALLRQVGVTAVRYIDVELRLTSNNEKDIRRIATCTNINCFFEARDRFYEEMVALKSVLDVTTFELVPPDVVQDPLAYLGTTNSPRILMAREALGVSYAEAA